MTSTAPARAAELPAVQRRTVPARVHATILPTGTSSGAVAGADLFARAHVRGAMADKPHRAKALDNGRSCRAAGNVTNRAPIRKKD